MMQDKVLLAHGGGGGLTGELIREKILSRFGNPALRAMNDSAVLPVCGERVAFTTDSFVVSPWEFPGGNLGDLAVCGTVNDLAMVGATPRYLSLSMILEEGLPLEVLDAVLDAVARRVAEC
jgi:hydrogenase expression/formation protein HypE